MDNILLQRRSSRILNNLVAPKPIAPILGAPLETLSSFEPVHPTTTTTTSPRQLINATKLSVWRMAGITIIGVMLILFVVDPPFIYKSTDNTIERGEVNTINVLTWSVVSGLLVVVIALYKQHTVAG